MDTSQSTEVKRWYIAGRMSGIVGFNYAQFNEAELLMKSLGHEVFNPAKISGGDTSKPYAYYIKEGLKGLLECTDILLLPRWGDSPGAKMEAHVATKLGFKGWQIKDNKLVERPYTTEIYSMI